MLDVTRPRPTAPTVAVAAPHGAGVDAARAVVARGGGAIDAALAAAAVLTVAYPHQCSAAGDLVAVVRPAGGSARAVLSVGAAPSRLDVVALRAAGPRMPPDGPLTVTVPGVVAGWAALHRFGARLPLADLLAPAITLADDGVAISPGLARCAVAFADVIRQDRGLTALLLDPATGQPWPVGHLVRQPALAATLGAIGEDWRGYYSGSLAGRIAAGLVRLGSPLTADDLAAHHADVTEPLRRDAYGATWSVAPPPSQGATLLALLTADNAGAGPGTARRRLLAARSAELRRDALLGDPRGGPVDVAALLGDAGHDGADGSDPAAALAALVAAAGTPGPKPAGDTVAVAAVDSDGAAVTLLQSVFQSFGAGLLEPDTGLVLHNRGSAFRLEPGHPGAPGPGLRPPHTLCPALAELPGGDTVALGCQGGRAQAWILSQVAADALASPDLPGVLARPRWVIGSRDVGQPRPSLVREPGVADGAELAAAAADAALAVVDWPGPHDDAGHVQVARLRAGTLTAATDPRADGAAAVI